MFRDVVLTGMGLVFAACSAWAQPEQTEVAADEFTALPDPTRPLLQPAPVEDAPVPGGGLLARLRGYELSSILIRPGLRIAVINSQRVGVGDSIGGARVLAIEPGRVTLEEDGVSRDLSLYGNSIKTPVIEAARGEGRP